MKFGMSVRSALVAPLALGVMMVGTAQVARAQTPSPAQPTQQPRQQPHAAAGAAQAAPAQAENPTFSAPAGLLLVQIKPDKTADYEAMITKLKDALTKSEKPERKAMAKAWKVYKASEPARGQHPLRARDRRGRAWRLHQSAADHLGSVPDRGAGHLHQGEGRIRPDGSAEPDPVDGSQRDAGDWRRAAVTRLRVSDRDRFTRFVVQRADRRPPTAVRSALRYVP